MKQLKFILLLSFCIFLLNHAVARDIVNCSKTYNSFGKKRTSTSTRIKVSSTSSASGAKIKIENQTGIPDYTGAFKKAAKLLAEGISDDFPLTIQIKLSDDNDPDFSTYTGTFDFVAITTTNFVLNNFASRNPNTLAPDRNTSTMDKLIPQAIANREYLADTDPTTPDMVIKLNKNIDFYTDTLNTNISDTQYDLVTVILREMVTGCGFLSSFKMMTDPTTYITTLYNKQIASNNIEYPYSFDTFIKNDEGISFSNVINSTSSISSFLNGNQIFLQGNELYNELLISPNDFSSLTLNTLNRTNDLTDLMTSNFFSGNIIRTITPITKSILQTLGWNTDEVPSLRNNKCNIISTSGPTITDLNPNTNYTYKTDINQNIDWGGIQFFGLYLVKSNGDFYTLAQDNYNLGVLSINYSTLPNYEWQRDPETGAVIGYIFFTSYNENYSSWVGTDKFYFNGFKKVLLAYAPTSASISATKTNVTTSTMDAKLDYLSQGATSYKINYSISGDATQYSIDKPNKEDVSYLLEGLNPNRKCSIYITAENASGSINSPTVTIGEDPLSAMVLSVTKVGTTLKYRFVQGNQYVTNLTINSVNIYDTNGLLKMTVNAGINQTFSIATLPSGYYVLKVDVANSSVFSKIFAK